MNFQESYNVELKREVVEDIRKEIIAFANSEGGTLYIGVNNDGSIYGVSNIDETMLQISNMVRDTIKPDITMFMRYDILEQDDKKIISVNIQRGTNRPYYYTKKGLRPEGVYVRQGTSSVPATDTAIRQMIKETDGDSYEEKRSLEQSLTFEATSKEFKQRELAFGLRQMQTLKIINADGIYTNLGFLLSEQCVHTIKIAVFEGSDKNVFKDRKEFTGSLVQQLNDVYNYIDLHNQTYSTFDKLLRIDSRDYPEVAVREALLNSVIHRDYALRASTLISIYKDRIEFVSAGGLLPGITLDDVMLGLSVCRNQNLANIFYQLQLIETYGTGIKKIMNAYSNCADKPKIESTSHAFKIILPNKNVNTPTNIDFIDKNEKIVFTIAKEKGFVTRADVECQLDVSSSTASRLLRSMTDKNALSLQGKGKNIKYVLNQSHGN